MNANSFYTRFKELFEEQERVSEDILVLTKEVHAAGEDVVTMKRLAKLAVRDKLKAEAEKFKRLQSMAKEQGELFE